MGQTLTGAKYFFDAQLRLQETCTQHRIRSKINKRCFAIFLVYNLSQIILQCGQERFDFTLRNM